MSVDFPLILRTSILFDAMVPRNLIIVINFSDYFPTLGDQPPMFHTQALIEEGRRFHSPKHQECVYYSPRLPETIGKTCESTGNRGNKKWGGKDTHNSKEIAAYNNQKVKYSPSKQDKYAMIYQPNGNYKSKILSPDPTQGRRLSREKSQARIGGCFGPKAQKEKMGSEAKTGRQNIQAGQYYQSSFNDKQQNRKKEIQKWKSSEKDVHRDNIKIEEVTFSLESTQPETDEKQLKNQYDMPVRKQKPSFQGMQKSSNQFLNSFRKKIIEKQIIQKEQVYRSFIRSQSRQRNQEDRAKIKSRMKEVMNEIYELKKLIRN